MRKAILVTEASSLIDELVLSLNALLSRRMAGPTAAASNFVHQEQSKFHESLEELVVLHHQLVFYLLIFICLQRGMMLRVCGMKCILGSVLPLHRHSRAHSIVPNL